MTDTNITNELALNDKQLNMVWNWKVREIVS
jgi:hypothetical protein